MLIYFLPTVLLYNKPKMSKNHTEISFITWFCRKSNCDFGILKFEIASIQITEGSDNGDSNNWGSTVFSSTLPFKKFEDKHVFLSLYSMF